MLHRTHALIAGALLAACAAPALAGSLGPAIAEGPVVAPAPVVVVPQAIAGGDWTGFYIGGQLSYGRLDYDLDDGDGGDADFDGPAGGLHAGYMHDFGHFVLGGEVAYDRADLDDDEAGPGFGAELEGVGRVGLRLGYDAGRVLPYATLGYATARFSENLAATGEDDADGTYVGGGVEYAVTDRFRVAGEVLRHEFDLDVDGLDTSLTTVGIRASYRF